MRMQYHAVLNFVMHESSITEDKVCTSWLHKHGILCNICVYSRVGQSICRASVYNLKLGAHFLLCALANIYICRISPYCTTYVTTLVHEAKVIYMLLPW